MDEWKGANRWRQQYVERERKREEVEFCRETITG